MKARLKRLTAILLSAVLVLTSFVLPSPVKAAETETEGIIQAEFFVDPVKGSDKNDGSYEAPFSTVQAAKDAVRKINQNMTGDIYVFLAAGEYYMDETLVFTEEDSGTNGHKIVYYALDGVGTAQLIGGKPVTSAWEKVGSSNDWANPDSDLPDDMVGKVYKTTIEDAGDGDVFYTLYVNDRRATLARTPNREQIGQYSSALTQYCRFGGDMDNAWFHAEDINDDTRNGLINAQKRGDLNASLYVWDLGYCDWMTSTLPFESFNSEGNSIHFKDVEGHPETYRPKYSVSRNGSEARGFLQGNLGMLDAPGEYYYNAKEHILYYYPENVSDLDHVVVPMMESIIDIKGSSRDSYVHDIEFNGLTVKDADHTDWYTYGWSYGDAWGALWFYPEEAKSSIQPSQCEQREREEFRYGNFSLENTKNISILNTRIKNSGMFGINMNLMNAYDRIENCVIEYTAHGGINIDGGYPGVGLAGDENCEPYSRENTVENVLIHDIGELIGQASGITIQQSGYNLVTNVEVYNSPRRGIFLTAGYSRNKDATTEYNDCGYIESQHMTTHHNTIQYVYLHDCQQDGGDDGAFFTAYIHYTNDPAHPNYVNQMLVDNVGGNPTMHDIGPNGINLDMGNRDIQMSDVKVVNPQHYNIEGSSNCFTNVNADFTAGDRNPNPSAGNDNLANFDDSKMEYDKIGITVDFPAEFLPEGYTRPQNYQKPVYDDLYFSEDFEAGIDYNKWSAEGTPEITTEWMSEGVFGGKQALQLNADAGTKPILYRTFPEELNKIVTVKMFDRAGFMLGNYDTAVSINTSITTYATVSSGDGKSVAMGIDNSFGGGSDGVYVFKIGEQKVKTDIGRIYGWHELTFDFSGGTVKMFFDGKELTVPEDMREDLPTSFNQVAFGTKRNSGITFFDELYIYGGKAATQPIGDAELPAVPQPVVLTIPGEIEAEAAKELSGCQIENGALGYLTAGGSATYSVTVKETAVYEVTYCVAANNNSCKLSLCKGGKTLDTLSFDNTGGWAGWKEITSSNQVVLEAGEYDISLNFVTNGYNIDYIRFTKTDAPVPTEPEDPEEPDVPTGPNLVLDFEDGTLPAEFETAQTVNYQIVEHDDGKALYVNAADGSLFFKSEAADEWENYSISFDWEFDGWGDNNIFGNIYDNFTIYFHTTNGSAGNHQVLFRRVPNGTDHSEFATHYISGDPKWGFVDLPKDFMTQGSKHHIEVRIEDGVATLLIDGSVFAQTNDPRFSTHPTGSFGIGGLNCKFYIDNLTVKEIVPPTVSYDFEDGQIPKDYDTSGKTNGNVEIVTDTDTGSKVLYQTCGDFDGFFLSSEEEMWENYTIEFDWKFDSWQDTDWWFSHFTIYFRKISTGNYQLIYRRNNDGRYSDNGNQPLFQFNYHGNDAVIEDAQLPEDFVPTQWNHFTLEVKDSTFTFSINGKQVMQATHEAFKTGGIGFGGFCSSFYIDNLQVYVEGQDPVTPEDPVEYLTELDFEDGKNPGFRLTEIPNDVQQEIVADDSGKSSYVLHQVSTNGHAFYGDDAEWENYTLSFRCKLGEWGSENILNNAYDNFTIYLMTQIAADGSNKDNPGTYQVIIRRNQNGTDGYPAGTEYIELYRHNPGEVFLARASLPEGFDTKEWHDYTIQVSDGQVGLAIDGALIVSGTDPNAPYKAGGFGFGGINANFYVDDIKVDTNPATFTYTDTLGLTNVEMNGKFNPAHYSYYVRVKDVNEHVTFTMPTSTIPGAEVEVTLNGVPIGAGELDLNNGKNTLVITEKSIAGNKTYTVTIVKPITVTNVEQPAPVTTAVGVAPTLPATVKVTFSDNSMSDVKVNWRMVHPGNYKYCTSFTATGTLEGFACETVSVHVTVNGLTGVDALPEVQTEVGAKPSLATALTAHYSDGDKQLPLTFDTLDASLYAQPGVIFAVGRAEGYAFDVLQKVVVKGTTVNKNALRKAISDAESLNEQDYTAASWAELESALRKAKDVLNDSAATQKEVDAAAAALNAAIANLKEEFGYPIIILPGSGTSKPTTPMDFTDVSKGDWFYEDVKYVYDNGIMNGVGDSKFAPYSTLTRAMVVTILYRMEGEPSARYNAMFTDVINYQWYTEGVEWAACHGIVLGYGDGKFGPNDPVTREQLATILYRYAQYKNYVLAEGSSLAGLTDASNISSYAVTAVKWAVAGDLLDDADGKLLPLQNATRAEVAHAIAGFCKLP